MKILLKYNLIICLVLISFASCDDDFLDRYPLSEPSSETFWTSAKNAELWINDLYNGLPGPSEIYLGPTEGSSDNAWARTNAQIGKGAHTPSSSEVRLFWDYDYIRAGLTFLDKVEEVPDLEVTKKNQLIGQAKFIIAFKYCELITAYRDVPLITDVLSIAESDLVKSTKAEVFQYLIGQLDDAINLLPETWADGDAGRITKGAALALKARVLLYNEEWEAAANVSKEVMDLGIYGLHSDYSELFISAFDNQTNEVILDRQYVPGLVTQSIYSTYAFLDLGGFGSIQPTTSLANSFEMIDGLSIDESPLYDENDPMADRDPRFYETFILPFQTINGVYYDPVDGSPALKGQIKTNIFFRKYVNDMEKSGPASGKNWIIIRYADVLLMYAEAKNEFSGPDGSVYDAIDEVRFRVGMPAVDRVKYDSKESLRALIRNERRVEFAGEGLRYFDIIRWKIAEEVLSGPLYSFELPGILSEVQYDVRVFDSSKHYVWPIPQFAIDNAKNLNQHDEWK